MEEKKDEYTAEDFGFDEAADPAEDEVASELPTDEDGYLTPPTLEETTSQESVVVQDFDPADPGAPIAEPQKVLRPHDRVQRKRDRGSRE